MQAHEPDLVTQLRANHDLSSSAIAQAAGSNPAARDEALYKQVSAPAGATIRLLNHFEHL